MKQIPRCQNNICKFNPTFHANLKMNLKMILGPAFYSLAQLEARKMWPCVMPESQAKNKGIFNQTESTTNVWGTCDIERCIVIYKPRTKKGNA
jgi:hypothetical protein